MPKRSLHSAPKNTVVRAASVAVLITVASGCGDVAGNASGSASSGSRSRADRPPNVILISIDTLRADHVGSYGYERDTTPRIDQLARDGVLFENHVSNTSWTLPSHLTMLTGLAETVHGVDNDDKALDPGRTTLAEVLRDAGYRTAGFFSGPYLYPTFGFAQGFEVYENCITIREPPIPMWAWNNLNDIDRLRIMDRHSYQVSTGPEIVARATAWLESLDGDGPFFLFLHFFDCHWDYMPPDRYWKAFDPDYDGDLNPRQFVRNKDIHADMPERDLQHLIARYDGEILFTDDMVGRVLDFVDALGQLDDSLVVVTSDHGEEFFEHGAKGHRLNLYDESLRIPLILSLPSQLPAGARVPHQTSIVDVMPTILDVLDVEQPSEVRAFGGRSLAPLWSGSPPPELMERFAFGRLVPAEAGAPMQRFIRAKQQKLLTARLDGSDTEALIYFDLANDPAEQHPKRGTTGDTKLPLSIMYKILVLLQQHDARDAGIQDSLMQQDPGLVPHIDSELRRQLIENGYLSGN